MSSDKLSRLIILVCVLTLLTTFGLSARDAQAQSFSCSASISPTVLTTGEINLGDTVRINLEVGVGDIQGGTLINITNIQHALSCFDNGILETCTGENPQVVSYVGNVSNDCDSISFTGSVIGNIITLTPSPSPLQLLANTSCNIQFDLQMLGVSGDSTPRIIEEASFFPGICDNIPPFSGNANGTVGIVLTVHPDVETLSNPTLADGDQVQGVSVTDTATVSGPVGAPTPTGDVTFYLCQPGEVTAGGCVSPAGTQVGAVKALVGGTATSDPTTNTNTNGTYCWRAEYAGDAVYEPASHTDETDECFTVAASCGDEEINPQLGETCDPPGQPGPGPQPGVCRNGGTAYQCTYCGDGVLQTGAGEQCDDGNGVNFDGCNNDCEIETCNVLVDKGVDCGTGQVDVSLVSANDDGTNGCSADNGDTIMVGYQVQNTGNVDLVNCNLTDSNGNIIAPGAIGTVGAGNTTPILFPTNTPLICSDALEAGEPDTATVVCECGAPQSGLGQATAFDTADFECLPICGDGNIDPGETCDPPGQPGPNTAQPGMCRNSGSADQCTYCGDGIRQAAEECDDGNGVDGDGCSNICESEDVPVPTMNEWGMILFVIFAGLGAVYYLRRKRFNS